MIGDVVGFGGTLPKFTELTLALKPCPAPLTGSTAGGPGLLSLSDSDATSGPTIDGTNPSSNEHELDGATVAGGWQFPH